MSSRKGDSRRSPAPRVQWWGPTHSVRPPARLRVRVARLLMMVLAFTNPVSALCALVAMFVVTRRWVVDRIRTRWVVAVGASVTLVVAVLGGVASYRAPYTALASQWGVSREAMSGGTLPTRALHPMIVELQSHWGAWALAQLPLALGVGVLVASHMHARRRRYRATWRSELDTSHSHLSGKAAAVAHARAERQTPELMRGEPWLEAAIPLGITGSGKPVTIRGAQLRSHIVLTGPTGEGKTTTLVRLLDGLLVRWRAAGFPAVVFDFKADPELVETLRRMAEATGRRLHVVSVTTTRSEGYNPLAHGTPEQLASSLIEMIGAQVGFSEPHHKSEGQRWLLLCLTVLDELVTEGKSRDGKPWRRSLDDLVELMRGSGRGLKGVLADISPQLSPRVSAYLADVAAVRDKNRSLDGMTTRIALLVETSAGRVVAHPSPTLDLHEAIVRGDLVVFSLDADADADGAATVGALAVADLHRTLARLKAEAWTTKTGKRVIIPLDEFTGLGGRILGPMFSRARSAGGTLIISTQTDADLETVSTEFAANVWANSNVHLLHRQHGKAASDRADAIGTQAGWQETVQVTEDTSPLGDEAMGSGVGSLRRVERYIVHPNELRHLQAGQIIMTSHTPRIVERVAVTAVPQWVSPAEHVQDVITHAPSNALAERFGVTPGADPAHPSSTPPAHRRQQVPATTPSEDAWGLPDEETHHW